MCTQQTDLTGLTPPTHTHTTSASSYTQAGKTSTPTFSQKSKGVNQQSTQADNGQQLPSYFRLLFLAVGISIPSRISQ